LKSQKTEQQNNRIKKWAKELNTQFPEEKAQMTNKHVKKHSTSLARKEMQIKTTQTFHLAPSDRPSLRKETTNAGKYAWINEPSYTVCGSVN
jgi:hypothetical protein